MISVHLYIVLEDIQKLYMNLMLYNNDTSVHFLHDAITLNAYLSEIKFS